MPAYTCGKNTHEAMTFDNCIIGTDNIDQTLNAPNDGKPTNSYDDKYWTKSFLIYGPIDNVHEPQIL